MKKVFMFLLAVALIWGIYYFFFSETAKKKSLIKQIQEKYKNPNDKPEELMKLSVETLQAQLNG
jgi:hypothetical protein